MDGYRVNREVHNTKETFIFSLILPSALLCIALVYTALNPEVAVAKMPALYQIRAPSNYSLPLDITKISRSNIFVLGTLAEKLSGATTAEAQKVLVEQAKNIVPSLDAEKLKVFGEFLEEAEKEGGFTEKIRGLFSFVNFIWLLSIFGVLIAIGPVIYLFARPLERLISTIYHAVLVPLFYLSRPFLGFFGYAFSYLFIVQGLRYPKEADSSFYVSFTGMGFAILILFYGFYLYLPPSEHTLQGKRTVALICYSTMLTILGSLAPYFQSNLLSYLCVAAIFGCLGFTIIPVPLGLFIGFHDDETLVRCLYSSFSIVTLFVVLKSNGFIPPGSPLRIFSSAVSVLGVNVFFLAMLISSSRYYRYRGSSKDWALDQVRYVLCLLAAIFAGNFFNMQGISNVAYVYSVLYALDKSAEMDFFHSGSRIWLLIFLMSLVLWKISLYLHDRPEILMGLLNCL